MNCAKCGKELKPGQEYCESCGAVAMAPPPAVYKAGGYSAAPAPQAPPVAPSVESPLYSAAPIRQPSQEVPAAESSIYPAASSAPRPPVVPPVGFPVYSPAESALQPPPVVPPAESTAYSTTSAARPPIPGTPPPSYTGYRAAPAYGAPQYPPYQPGYPMGGPAAYGWGYTVPQPPPAWQPKKLAKKQQDPLADLPFTTTELLSAKQSFTTILLGLIPLIGLVLCMMWRNSDTAPPQKKNMASALLALHGIALALLVVGLAIWVFNLWGALPPGSF